MKKTKCKKSMSDLKTFFKMSLSRVGNYHRFFSKWQHGSILVVHEFMNSSYSLNFLLNTAWFKPSSSHKLTFSYYLIFNGSIQTYCSLLLLLFTYFP